MTIELDPDWYGSYARRSAVADFLELMALRDLSWSVEDLADRIRDSRWMQILGERIGVPSESESDEGDIAEELDQALERAQDVLAVIRERSTATDGQYPFQLDETSGRLRYRGPTPVESPYVRLLCITVGHATGVKGPLPPHQVFEGMVQSAFSTSGLRTTGIGARSRAGGSFGDVLTSCCADVGLDAYPSRAASRVFANDEGSDILSNLWPHDFRPGGVQLVGQVTCAKSNDWDTKIQEPAPMQWRDWLGGMRSPVVYLAVPHHVEQSTRSWLMQKRDRDVVDRLRLCPMLSDPVVGETEVVEIVLASAIA